MTDEQFQDYFKSRYQRQIDWYDRRASRNKFWYSVFQTTLIIIAAIVPILALSNLKWPTVVTSALVAIITGLIKTFKFQENWISFRTTCETLKKEQHLFDAECFEYKIAPDKKKLFVERVEALISRENTLWPSTHHEKLPKRQEI